MKRDDQLGDPYGVPTGAVPRVRQTVNLPFTGATVPCSAEAAAMFPRAPDWPSSGMCKHGFIPPENCAACNQLGVEQAPPAYYFSCPHGVPPDKCADCSDDPHAIHREHLAAMKPRATQIGGDHYAKLTIQPWDACEAWLTKDQFAAHLIASAVQHLARFNATDPGKGGLQDVQKAAHNLAKAIEVLTK